MSRIAEIYGQTVRADNESALLDAIGAALAGRAYDPAHCRMIDAPSETQAPTPEAAEAAQIAQRGDGWNTVGVSELGAARATADAAKLTELGFTVPPPLYAVGSLVNSTGVANATRKRIEHNARPVLGDAVADFCNIIRAENRRDIEIEPSRLTFTDNGAVKLPNGEALDFSALSFGQFAARLDMPKGAGTYLAGIPQDMRAWNLRKWVTLADPKPFKLRLRRENEIFACVSTKYADYGLDLVARDMVQALSDLPDLRATLDYDGQRVQIDATTFSDVQPERFVAGEVFQVGARVASADDGTGSAKGGGSADRNLCLNLFIVASMQAGGFSVAHRGSREAFRKALRQGFDGASQAARHFVQQWNGVAQTTDLRGTVLATDGDAFVPTGNDAFSLNQLLWGVFAAEQARGSVPAGQKELAGIMRAWNVEPEANRRGIANALTRYAHEGQADAWHANELETAAVQLLTAKRPLEWTDPSTVQKRLS